MYLLSNVTGSCDHTAFIIAMPSSMRRPRSLNGTPSAANSGSSQPTPTPMMSRPPERLCSVDNSLASGSGWRIGSTSTLVPSRTRSVTAATQVRVSTGIVEQRRARELRARHDDVLADPDVAEPHRLGAPRMALDQRRRRLAAGMRQVNPDCIALPSRACLAASKMPGTSRRGKGKRCAFEGKVALITAAASGIGRATADIMAREGAVDRRRRQQRRAAGTHRRRNHCGWRAGATARCATRSTPPRSMPLVAGDRRASSAASTSWSTRSAAARSSPARAPRSTS